MHETIIKGFIGCDWGSSNFRLALIGMEGEVIQEYDDAGGVVLLRQQGVDTEGLVRHLRDGLTVLAGRCSRDLSNLPLIISGMAGSSLGVCEVPYASLPLVVGGEGLTAHDVGPLSGIQQKVYIIAGVCSEDDVMRGEETEAVGLMDGLGLRDALIILPGTHSKHLRIRNGSICAFKTYMTGELFQILTTNSILKHALNAAAADPFDDHGRSCFIEGLEMARSSELLHELFTLRSRVLLKHMPMLGNFHRLSGLMIGYELFHVEDFEESPVILGGAGPLHDRYRLALKRIPGVSQVIEIPTLHRSRAVWRGQFLSATSIPAK
ncbi:MAG: 2-dehydro-3-deoxygalactonokinase [Chitinophagaceae bacterium]|jgi:2-dehydro-3-deoxygalactonokinase|nr:2-dehydro-3-deoxygalactonokinase [Chitinophagaceae bacterium]